MSFLQQQRIQLREKIKFTNLPDWCNMQISQWTQLRAERTILALTRKLSQMVKQLTGMHYSIKQIGASDAMITSNVSPQTLPLYAKALNSRSSIVQSAY